jgi:hypothetical protein
VFDKSKRKGPRALADLAAAPINAVLAKAGFAQTEVVSRWDEIVGEDLAKRTAPLKIIYPRRPSGHEEPEPGTLVVRVETPFALEAQHRTDQIIARVNAFFGWRCVARVKLQQAPYLRKTVSKPKRPPADEPRLHTATAEIADPGLKAALERLGRSIGGMDHK